MNYSKDSERKNIGKGLPDMRTAKQACNAILLMSGTTNGKRAVEGWKSLKEKTGKDFEFVSKGREEEDLTLEWSCVARALQHIEFLKVLLTCITLKIE
ncbi:hypothetical protein [Staphylococcus nepalensis]|uniref:hypothetical protein n=1 Tax=Staphylococcus nepalensis TaxID=214473 RepID=UPI00383A6A55